MFHMMNEARVGVGVCATALGTAGYYHSLEYATTRTQGRPATSRDPTLPQVRYSRFLINMRLTSKAARALLSCTP